MRLEYTFSGAIHIGHLSQALQWVQQLSLVYVQPLTLLCLSASSHSRHLKNLVLYGSLPQTFWGVFLASILLASFLPFYLVFSFYLFFLPLFFLLHFIKMLTRVFLLKPCFFPPMTLVLTAKRSKKPWDLTGSGDLEEWLQVSDIPAVKDLIES